MFLKQHLYFWRHPKWLTLLSTFSIRKHSVLAASSWYLPIAYRLGITYAALAVCGLGALGMLALESHKNAMQHQVMMFGETVSEQISQSATEFMFTDDVFNLQILANNNDKLNDIYGIAFYNESGVSVVSKGKIPEAFLDFVSINELDFDNKNHIVEWQDGSADSSTPLISFIAPIQFQGVTGGAVLVSLSTQHIVQSYTATRNWIIGSMVFLLLTTLVVAFWLTRQIAKPFATLIQSADMIGTENFSAASELAKSIRSNNEIGHLSTALSESAIKLADKQKVEALLSRFVADDVAKAVMGDLDHVQLGCHEVDASVLFVDIVGYTELSEHESDTAMVQLLNEYLAYFTQCARLFFGTVDKFIGDCAMVIFGTPQSNADHRFNAIACALVMQQLVARLNVIREREGLHPVQIRVGINSGNMMAGFVGASQRMEYTVLGDSVNVASRLCESASPGEVVIGEGVLTDASVLHRVDVVENRHLYVRGRTHGIKTWHATAVAAEYQRTMKTMIDDILQNRSSNRSVETELPNHPVSELAEATMRPVQLKKYNRRRSDVARLAVPDNRDEVLQRNIAKQSDSPIESTPPQAHKKPGSAVANG